MATREQRESRKEQLLAGLSLVELTGSEKQVTWAQKIRVKKLDHVALCLACEQISQEEKPRANNECEHLTRVLSHLASISDSAWWIQVRDCTDLDNPLFWERERKQPLKVLIFHSESVSHDSRRPPQSHRKITALASGNRPPNRCDADDDRLHSAGPAIAIS